MISTVAVYIGAAIAEIGGCFAFWAYFRLGRSIFWFVPGIVSLMVSAFLLIRIDGDYAGTRTVRCTTRHH
ncbi:hypothetical protein [Hyphomonas sp. GM-8P]|uniref:hypothetical protein n=1 Tax=Hyphomonas sp. GM-8P TaxID=1280945 RepID=UPI00351A7485